VGFVLDVQVGLRKARSLSGLGCRVGSHISSEFVAHLKASSAMDFFHEDIFPW
jgi:hypothetical protein